MTLHAFAHMEIGPKLNSARNVYGPRAWCILNKQYFGRGGGGDSLVEKSNSAFSQVLALRFHHTQECWLHENIINHRLNSQNRKALTYTLSPTSSSCLHTGDWKGRLCSMLNYPDLGWQNLERKVISSGYSDHVQMDWCQQSALHCPCPWTQISACQSEQIQSAS